MRTAAVTRTLTRTLAAALAAFGAGLAGCGGAPPATAPAPTVTAAPAARAELAARAAAAQDLVGVGFYTLTTPGRDGERSVMVVRAADGGWRVDIAGGGLGGAADISVAATRDGRYQCALARPSDPGRCVAVDPLPAGADPRVHRVFTDWLDVLTDRSAALAVAAAPAPDGAEPDGPAGACFAVEPSTASLVAPLAAGVYCFRTDGTLTAAALDLGTLTLVGSDATAPATIDLPGEVVDGDPLPTAAPTPSPTPTPTRRTAPAG